MRTKSREVPPTLQQQVVLTIRSLLPPEHRKEVIVKALQHRATAKPSLRNLFDILLRERSGYLKVHGYRDASKAPPILLKDALLRNANVGEVIETVTALWEDANPELRHNVRTYLTEQGIPLREGILSNDLSGEWSLEEVTQKSAEFCETHPAYFQNDAMLMLCCQAGLVPMSTRAVVQVPQDDTEQDADMIEGEIQSSPESIASIRWQKMLEAWQVLPADAPEWEDLEGFLGSLRQLAQSKIAEREQIRERLRAAIERLRSPRESNTPSMKHLAYFELSTEGWGAETCPLTMVETIANQVDGLIDRLTQYAHLESMPAADISARRQRREQEAKLENEISDLYAKLSSALSPADLAASSQFAQTETQTAETVIRKQLSEDDQTLDIPPIYPDAVSPESPEPLADSTNSIVSNAPESASQEEKQTLDEESQSSDLVPRESQTEETLHTESAVISKPLLIEEEQADETDSVSSKRIRLPAETVLTEETVPASVSGSSSIHSSVAGVMREEIIWSMIKQDDLSGAYWLAQSLQKRNQDCPMDASLLEACQGARWLTFGTNSILDDIQAIALTYVPKMDGSLDLLIYAGSLLPALLSADNLFDRWLVVPAEPTALREVVQAIHDFALRRHALSAIDCSGGSSSAKREAAIQDVSNRAKLWLQKARQKHQDIRRAQSVWENLIKSEPIQQILESVSANRKADLSKVLNLIGQVERREEAQTLIVETGRKLHHRKGMDIVGNIRETMIRDLIEVSSIARHWCDLIEREQGEQDWFTNQISLLFERLNAACPRACQEMKQLADSTEPLPRRASAQCLLKALQHLGTVLSLHSMPSQPTIAEYPEPTWWVYNEQGRDETLHSALGRRFLWTPDLSLDKDAGKGQLIPPEPEVLLKQVALYPPTLAALRDTLQVWRERQDFRFYELILSAFSDEEEILSLRKLGQNAYNKANKDLSDEKERLEKENVRALSDGVLSDEEYTNYETRLQNISTDIPHASHAFQQLKQIEHEIEEARRKKSADLHKLWKELQVYLEASVASDQWKQIQDFIDHAFQKHDTRNVNEALAHLRDCRDKGITPDTDWISDRPKEISESRHRDMALVLEEFIRVEEPITDTLREGGPKSLNGLISAIEKRATWNGLAFGQISPARLTEAQTALYSWQTLKQKRASSIDDGDLPLVQTILDYLGFTHRREDDPLRLKQQDRDWIYVTAPLSVGEDSVRPIPQFGSAAEGRYHIICFWDKLETVAMSTRLEALRLTSDSILVFYLGSLKMQQRLSLSKIKLSFAVLDETLLAFLALQRDNRLQAFLRCSLPFTKSNPYTPDRAGAVPKEMFFGRRDMVEQLMDKNGSCIVYGGRQLGKTALLVHTQREFHQPDRDQFAWIEDIKLTGASALCTQSPDTLYRKLVEGFVKQGLLKEKELSLFTPKDILKRIEASMQSQPERRVLVMFDEADNFLEADSAKNFPIVTALRDLMNATDRRFKVVFAGLHHVQKFQHIPNQPLAHFGAPILVGPLSPRDAQQLVREPFEALGFRLLDEEGMRILSYTNRHPGLIQKYCFELLKKLHNITRQEFPTPVDQRRVEEVYLDKEVRNFIEGRFELTLNLDDRYRMIAYSIIFEQHSERDSYARVYPDYEILRLVQIWGPQLFAETDTDGMRFLLEEMCGLGVLIHAREQGGYRLRSPNLVHLLSTAKSIETRLEELAAKPPVPRDNLEESHAPLDDALRRYSPLTRTQETGLNAQRSGVSILFASPALGLERLSDVVRRFLPPDPANGQPPSGQIQEMPSSVTGEAEVRQWLENFARTNRTSRQRISYQYVSNATTGLEKRIRAAIAFCKETKRNSRPSEWTQVFFFFDPVATASWLGLQKEMREEIENNLETCTWPRLWSEFGVRQRLLQLDLPGDATSSILEATGGWHWLLEHFFDRYAGNITSASATQMLAELRSQNSRLNADFKNWVGLKLGSPYWRIWKFICQMQSPHDGLSQDDITPELMEETDLTQSDCEHAIEILHRLGCLTRNDDCVHIGPFLAERFGEELK